MMEPSLSAIFQSKRERWAALGDTLGIDMLTRLERDHRMVFAWRTWARHCPERAMVSNLLEIIRHERDLADNFHLLPSFLKDHAQDFGAVKDAISLLLGKFSGPWWPDNDDDESANSVRESQQKARELRAALNWAQTYVSAEENAFVRLFDKEFPVTQKRSDPPKAFQVMLCTKIYKVVGRPLYGFVATVTDVIYELDTPTSQESVRATWGRNNAKRNTRTV